jgi:hypothetical protein
MLFSSFFFNDSLWLFPYRHQELLDRQGIYANMWQQQLTAEQADEKDNQE